MLISFFNLQGIPKLTLQRYSKDAAHVDIVEDNKEANYVFNKDLDTLQAYLLVLIIVNNNIYKMHAFI